MLGGLFHWTCNFIALGCLSFHFMHSGRSAVVWWLRPRTPKQEVGASILTRVAMLMSSSNTQFTLQKYWTTGINTQVAVAPSEVVTFL